MFATAFEPQVRRRGIVLVLVLGMLGLMALIGVTFATFAGQALISGRNLAQGIARPQAETLMDYALAQLINDTNNPLSAIRGHSLLRDMYGNDSVYRGTDPLNSAAVETGGILSGIPTATGSTPLQFTAYQAHPTGSPTPFYNALQYATNIPTTGQYYGLNFTRWTIRMVSQGVPQTFEVLEDDSTSSGVHLFTLSSNLINPTTDGSFGTPPSTSGDWTSFIYNDPNNAAPNTSARPYRSVVVTAVAGSPNSYAKEFTHLAKDVNNSGGMSSNAFVLDGRYMRAFNGAGLTRPAGRTDTNGVLRDVYPYNFAAYANFRIFNAANATYGFPTIGPDDIGMDEDYDACDLENWFMAIQSADGQIMIPSFHRPGILTQADWTSNGFAAAKILRPRQIDESPLFPPDPSTPDSTTGALTYDVDNDGDGITDSVWLDLGYPVQRDPGGKLYKPLFAFMVLGLNGRLPLNTVGNLQARAIGDQLNTNGVGQAPLNTTAGLPASTTQISQPGAFVPAGAPASTYYNPLGLSATTYFTSQTYLDAPTWDHTSHLGYSVNEINPKFALQNAPSNVYPSANDTINPNLPNAFGTSYGQSDNSGLSVALTQLRNILAGTIPTDVQNPVPRYVIQNSNTIDFTNAYFTNSLSNLDTNYVFVDGQPWILPNNVADNFDNPAGSLVVSRNYPPVPGRWGEPEGIPTVLQFPTPANFADLTGLSIPPHYYNNTVRAGRSYTPSGPNDVFDDDFDATDPPLVVYTALGQVNTANVYYNIPGTAGGDQVPPVIRPFPEMVDTFDGAGQMAVASERMRRYVTPVDPAGVGRMTAYMTRPFSDNDFGNGSDALGRPGFFRYFRPAGMPQEIRYPYGGTDSGYTASFFSSYTAGTPSQVEIGQRFLMPQLFGTGQSTGEKPNLDFSDVGNNRYHGFQSQLTPNQINGTPNVTAAEIAVFAAMMHDWSFDRSTGSGITPSGYANNINLQSPTINPNLSLATYINTESGPNLGFDGNPQNPTPVYPIGYGGYADATATIPPNSPVVNGYLGGSLNKDEADEMNLYTHNRFDQPYGPSDLEWLYRLHDIDGSTLTSRLGKLAPISFLNPADGLTRRRLFSTDSWDLSVPSYANDNPIPYAGVVGGTYNGLTNGGFSTDHNFGYNSRFGTNASPSFEVMNQVVATSSYGGAYANPVATEFLPNPTFPPQNGNGNGIQAIVPNSTYKTSPIPLPGSLATGTTGDSLFNTAITLAQVGNYSVGYPGRPYPFAAQSGSVPASMVPVQIPSLAHRDRKINLNMPLPISNDPAEPIRQKLCREAYQLAKAILPPAAIDTPEELATLSQFIVNVVDFRDPDCTATRFVNTDLEVYNPLNGASDVSNPVDPMDSTKIDPFFNASPTAVRFATNGLPAGHFPYDPSIYSPDTYPSTGRPTFLVQHGMEYPPVAINEVMAYASIYNDRSGASGVTRTNQRMFIELVNTNSSEQNNSGTDADSSSINLAGWDIVITPDAYGWGRPDPITGEPSLVAVPPLTPPVLPATNPTKPAINNSAPLNQVRPLTGADAIRPAITPTAATTPPRNVPAIRAGAASYYVLANENGSGAKGASNADAETVPTTPLAINATFPDALMPTPPAASSGRGRYFWVYLRRPANPFDTDPLTKDRPNREMVVVDSMRFPLIEVGGTTPSWDVNKGTQTGGQGTNDVYSTQRLQPYRGGHLVPIDTTPAAGATMPTGITTIAAPRPGNSFGYSEQSDAGSTEKEQTIFKIDKTTGMPANSGTAAGNIANALTIKGSGKLKHTIGGQNDYRDTNWALFPFHDRDFASVAELMMVPTCAPGLFTKQFVEEPYPGNSIDGANIATGKDDSNLSPGINAPGQGDKLVAGRKDFNFKTTPVNELPSSPTFPYLSDNFYYTAASVAPPVNTNTDNAYTSWTTEIGGWTGAGWHKLLEFFEVPSSANGAIGTADGGNNYDWARADLRPGLLNLNLIVDEEVFAGLIDDPRLNEQLALVTSAIPYVVTQIDSYGYPASLGATGQIVGRQKIFNHPSVNLGGGGVPFSTANDPEAVAAGTSPNVGRGYTRRDPDIADYSGTVYAAATAPNGPVFVQQVHGLKAAFSDFLKLTHGGSGHLFGYGAGPTGSGDYVYSLAAPVGQTQPIAASRPYRSLSYPDINYTIMRPASLPPSPVVSNGATVVLPGTVPALDPNLLLMEQYLAQPAAPYVSLNPAIAPRTATTPFQYVYDPGLKNPYLGLQYAPVSTAPAKLNPAPPYDFNYRAGTYSATPFPPVIPPIPSRRLIQIPDITTASTTLPLSNASLLGQYNAATGEYMINHYVTTPMLSSPSVAGAFLPPTLVDQSRATFAPDNYTPQSIGAVNNYLGSGGGNNDYRQHPLYRNEWLTKVMNLTTVRTHQFAVWITVGFFEVVRPGSPELGVPDVLGQEIVSNGKNVRYRSFFALDRTRATGFNPYYPGNFRDVVTYRRRIE